MINKLLFITISIIFIIIFISFYTVYISTHPRKYISAAKPSDFNLEYEQVTLKTKDNITLKGWFIPSNYSNSAIIVAHGYPFDKGNVLGFAPFLHKHYNLLFFDFRYLGESEGKFTSVGFHEKKDMQAAVQYLKEKDIENIGAIGFSLGASAIIMDNNKDIKAIVADSPYAELDLMVNDMYRPFFFLKYPFIWTTKLFAKLLYNIDINSVSPKNAIKYAQAPILLIHGEKDSQISVKHSILLHEANPDTELWIIENADHGQAHALKTKEYEKKVLEFFDKHLLKK